ncbi:MAG: hypothetical protein MZU97_21685 [Bacillus subtilis]|nr:hypothetical protein [Bacillus subtilis]
MSQRRNHRRSHWRAIFRAPKSFTTENVVEFSVHGGPYIAERIVACVDRARRRDSQSRANSRGAPI